MLPPRELDLVAAGVLSTAASEAVPTLKPLATRSLYRLRSPPALPNPRRVSLRRRNGDAGAPIIELNDEQNFGGPPVCFLQQPATFECPSHKGRIAPKQAPRSD